jgi:MoaA/NifB/PqqE/SkfB family radical SAM enzyme
VGQQLRADQILSRVVRYRLARSGMANVGLPLVLTFSVTNMCNSRCKTCNIWRNPKRHAEELNLNEIEKIFKSISKLYFLNISGGEPFLRNDIVDIIKFGLRYSSPNLIHIPSNGLLTDLIPQRVKEILDAIGDKKTYLTIKLSLDGVGESQDAVRGIPGCFAKVTETYSRLSKLRKEYPNFHLGFNTIISNFNLNNLDEIINYARSLEPDSFVTEIAENRSELFNLPDNITPDAETYKKLISNFRERTKQDLKHRRSISKFTEATRLVYYDYVVRILREKRQVLPCYAGVSNAHLNPLGEVWPCCILAYNQSMGNVRDFDCDFRKLWKSSKAKGVREYIIGHNCYCPMANQSYCNILCSLTAQAKVAKNLLLAR